VSFHPAPFFLHLNRLQIFFFLLETLKKGARDVLGLLGALPTSTQNVPKI
jgi:hypothetical protein